MSFYRLAWKEKVVKVIEALTNQSKGRIGEWGSKDFNVLWTGSLPWG